MKYFLSTFLILVSILVLSCSEVASDVQPVTSCVTIDDCPSDYICVDSFCKKDSEDPDKLCMDNADCSEGFTCNDDGKCIQKTCEFKEDCGRGKLCRDSKCIPGCESNIDCNDNKVCNSSTNKCEENTEEDCRDGGECEAGYECNEMTGLCIVSSDCSGPEDCAVGYECDGSQCIAKIKCSSDDECSDGEVCRADEYCGLDTGCDSDIYCENRNPSKPACSLNSGLCYQCTTDEHCTSLSNPICDTMTHTCGNENSGGECQSDSDCGLNKKCNTATSPHECIDMVTRCSDDNDCQNGMHCKTDGRCVMCLDNTHCIAPKECNANTNFCEEDGGSGGTGDGNQVCASDPTWGPLTCLVMSGTCDANGDCIVPDDPCASVTCPTHSTCSDGLCDCEAGYTMTNDTCVEDATCTGVTCPSNAHCAIESNEAGCYCDENYTPTDTNNDGQKDTCVADDPCADVTCSGHGSCINSSGTLSCNCSAGYHSSGLNCIIDSQNCDVDQFSNPLNNTSTKAVTVELTTYNNLSLKDDNCNYVEDWYKVILSPSTEFKASLTFTHNDGDIDIKLFKQSDTTSYIASSTTSTDNELITYSVTEQGTYYIRVYILSSSNTRAPNYSMTLSTRGVQAGNPGAVCTGDNDCYGTNSSCVETYTADGYCTSSCTNAGDTCMDTGVCNQAKNCFKTCTIGDDLSCGRDTLVCEDGGENVGGICIAKCTSNSDCNSNNCNINTGHCELNYMDCNLDDSYDDGCASGEFCTTYESRELCYPNGDGIIGAECEWEGDCGNGLGCIGNSTNGYTCIEYCKWSDDCATNGDVCYSFTLTSSNERQRRYESNDIYGYCD